jgi:hypothetical protein
MWLNGWNNKLAGNPMCAFTQTALLGAIRCVSDHRDFRRAVRSHYADGRRVAVCPFGTEDGLCLFRWRCAEVDCPVPPDATQCTPAFPPVWSAAGGDAARGWFTCTLCREREGGGARSA